MRGRVAAVDLMLVACVFLWAFNLILTKYVLTHGFQPLAYSVTRYGLATLVFVVIVVSLERSIRLRGRRDTVIVAWATVALTANQVCFVYAVDFTTATTVALVMGSTPIFAAIISTVVGYERLTSKIVIAGAASFAGVALVAAGGEGGLSRLSGDVKGVLLTVGLSATWAMYSVAIAPLMRRYSPYRISAIVLVAAWVALAALGSTQVARQEWDLAPSVWGALVAAAIGSIVLTNVLWFKSVSIIGPSRATLFANLNPFVAAILALLLLDETLTMLQVAGGLAIAAGVMLSRGPPTRAPHTE